MAGPSRVRITSMAILALFLASCATNTPPVDTSCGTYGAYVDAFPTPVSDATSVFTTVDDDSLQVAFTNGFTFPFYGQDYASVFVNTNGGLTFGAGEADYDLAASDVTVPAIAVFWGDMDAGDFGGATRANQMRWRQSSGCFQVAYQSLQDNDEGTWANSATLTLADDGTITVAYGAVESEDIMVGVFDGTHVDDRTPAVASSFDLGSLGTGVVLFDDFAGAGDPHLGELDGRTITYVP